jgi:hypothetical protein
MIEYIDIPATRFSKPRRLHVRVKSYVQQPDGSLKNQFTGRSMSAETLEIFKPAAAMDGITVRVTKLPAIIK